jgi:hypothetical protein
MAVSSKNEEMSILPGIANSWMRNKLEEWQDQIHEKSSKL